MKKTGEIIECSACGELKYLAGWYLKKQKEKGQKSFYCSQTCYSLSIVGRKLTEAHKKKIGESNFGKLKAGGKYMTDAGYVMIYAPLHPFKTSDGYVREHRLVMEASIGRFLLKKEVVHHVNGVKNDNSIENLVLFDSHASHMRAHTH